MNTQQKLALRKVEAIDVPAEAAYYFWNRSGAWTDHAKLMPSEFR